MLLGREPERQAIELVLAGARTGASAVLVFVGEAGIGKSALLDHAAGRAATMQVLRARGIESEAEIPFASLFELLRPALGVLDRIPEPQATALEGALALRSGTAQDRFAVGAATLSLLAAFAEQQPVAVLLDDAHWLDEPSAQALLFACRRLVADSVAVLVACREGERSVIAAADLPTLRLGGLSSEESQALLPQLRPDRASRLHAATGGNPLALLELSAEVDEFAFGAPGAAVPVPATISDAFTRRAARLSPLALRALVLAAASDTGDLHVLGLAAAKLDLDLDALTAADWDGLATLRDGRIEFTHVLARSAIYARASPAERRSVHRALASVLPDRDVDRRAWHLASAAAGRDDIAAVALEQAGVRACERSAYASAAAAFERAARLIEHRGRRAELLWRAAEAAWLAGAPQRAEGLLDQARREGVESPLQTKIDHLLGYMAIRAGRVHEGRAILTAAATVAEPEEAVVMLAEACLACFSAGDPQAMLALAQRAAQRLPTDASVRARFMTSISAGMAEIFGGDADSGARAIHAAVALVDSSVELDDPAMLPWLCLGALFLREAASGRSLIDRALDDARSRAALGLLPNLLVFVARDQAASDRWALADGNYREALTLAQESGQQGMVACAQAGLAGLNARRGRADECRADAAQALELADSLGLGLFQVWAITAIAELELSLGAADAALTQLLALRVLVEELGITDADVSPAPDLVEAYVRLGRLPEAEAEALAFVEVAARKGQPWSRARSLRAVGLISSPDRFDQPFQDALELHERTPDQFEAARTRLAYGERLRRAGARVLARQQLRAALDTFERLDARHWAERARAEDLAATGERVRRRDPSSVDELTQQELQIAMLLAAGKTTRQAAAAVFLSPKTVEYHLRHVYLKLGINTRDQLAGALDDRRGEPGS